MRPQFHYLDATTQQERMKGRRERELGETPRITEPRAVQMMVKAAADGDNVDTATTNKFLQKAEEEPWTKLRYHDEEVCWRCLMFPTLSDKSERRRELTTLTLTTSSCTIPRTHQSLSPRCKMSSTWTPSVRPAPIPAAEERRDHQRSIKWKQSRNLKSRNMRLTRILLTSK